MQLFENKGATSANKENNLRNRKKKLENLTEESTGLDKTLKMTQDIIDQGNAQSKSLLNQTGSLKGTRGKLDKANS